MFDELPNYVGLLALCAAALITLIVIVPRIFASKSDEHLAKHNRISQNVVTRMKMLCAEYQHYFTHGLDNGGYQLTELGKSADAQTMSQLLGRIDAMINFIEASYQEDDVNPMEYRIFALFQAIGSRRMWEKYRRDCQGLARGLILNRPDSGGKIESY
ncbi:MAG: hypothetical protein JWM07_858 [Candidatus Saccharibacteria bacterium]|nr:hypothetical protein [Candidatus Saccharibacteria bacterium]